MRTHPAGPRSGELHVDRPTGPAPADLNALDPAIWPRGAARGPDGQLTLAGVDARDLAASFGTPLMTIDEDDFRGRCQDFADAYGRAGAVHYAGKAFLCSEVVRWLDEEGLSLDVCTAGELALALKAGFPAERIALHGSNKSAGELAMAVQAGLGAIVLDSFYEIARLAEITDGAAVPISVMIRVTVGVEAHTHEFIATAHEDQKFGFSLAGGDAAEAVRRVVACRTLRLVGLHSHIGSQIFDPSGFEISAHRVVGLLKEIVAEHPQLAETIVALDLGGGLGIAYVPSDDPPAPDVMAKSLQDIVTRECQLAGLPVPAVVVEPGRAIAGPARRHRLRGRHHQGRRARRRAAPPVRLGRRRDERQHPHRAVRRRVLGRAGLPAVGREPVLCRVVGKHCESGDIVVRDCYLPADLAVGDLLAVAATGAYCYAMSSNYNRVPRPPVVSVADGAARLLLRRETDDDLMQLEMT